jgi:hypothetical protein
MTISTDFFQNILLLQKAMGIENVGILRSLVYFQINYRFLAQENY